jgi:hypothetical protein
MKTSDIIIAHPGSDDKFEALKAFMKALKIKFEITKEDTYKPEFVAKILQGDKDIKAGKTTKIQLDDIWK